MSFYLSAHVHGCVIDDEVVLLDIRENKYRGLQAMQARALAPHVTGWPPGAAGDPSAAGMRPKDVDTLIDELCNQHIISRTPVLDRYVAMPLPLVQTRLVRERPGARLSARLRDAGAIVKASLRAHYLLRPGRFERTVVGVRERKRALSQASLTSGPSFSSPEVRQSVEAFERLRPMLFAQLDNCLFDSLALVEYLAARGFFPTWVFGVRVRPFAAHCWVQDGSIVYNDLPEHARAFTPILAI